MNNKFFKFILIIMGAFIFIFFIWIRFIRERLPKDLPFILTEEKFYFLSYICIIYLFIIIILIFPRNPNKLSQIFLNYVYMPLTTLDTTLKTNKFILKKTMKFVSWLYEEVRPLNSKFFYSKKSFIVPLHLFFYLIPRCILIAVLLFDIFYFKKIEIFYYFLFIGILPLVNRYLKYCFKNVKEIYKVGLKKRWDSVVVFGDEDLLPLERSNFDDHELYEEYLKEQYNWHNKILTIDEFIDLTLENKLTSYEAYPFENKKYIKEKFFPNFSLEELNNNKIYEKKLSRIKSNLRVFDFLQKMSACEMITSYSTTYSLVTTIPSIKWLRILIFVLYFICWFYILCVSFHTLNDLSSTIKVIKWLNIFFINKEEPFSKIW